MRLGAADRRQIRSRDRRRHRGRSGSFRGRSSPRCAAAGTPPRRASACGAPAPIAAVSASGGAIPLSANHAIAGPRRGSRRIANGIATTVWSSPSPPIRIGIMAQQVLDAPRHRADLPERFDPATGGRHVAGARQAARGRLEAAMPQKCAGSANAAGAVAAQSEGRSAGGDQRRLAAARSAGGARRGRTDCWCGRESGCRSRRRRADRADWCGRSGSRRRRAGARPAWRRASEGGALRSPSVPAVQTVPATSIESLMENGTPSSGPQQHARVLAGVGLALRPRGAGSRQHFDHGIQARVHLARCARGAPPPVRPKRSRHRESAAPGAVPERAR